jgi:hypothetical protein
MADCRGPLSLLFEEVFAVKYVLTWTPRLGGSGIQNEEAAKRAYELYQKWTPPSGLNILQFLARADGEGGFAVVETDNPGDLAGIASKFAPYLIAQNYLVVEMEEWAALTGEGIEFRGSVG